MPATLNRRRRRLLITAALASAFIAVAAAVVLLAGRPAAYRPGDKVEGLTSELSRTLPQDYPRVTFTDVTREAGITFHHFWGDRTSQIPEDVGSGVAWGDYNNDGWPDLFLVNSVGPITLTPEARKQSPARCALYRNNKDGTFTDVTEQAGLDLRIWGMGAAWGDYDNDGWPDLVISAYGENHLYHNNGDGTFTDVTKAAGLGGRPGFWSAVAWGDYDRDGYLDLYITGYVKYRRLIDSAGGGLRYDVENPASINPSTFPPERNLLYHNNHDGTFTEVAAQAGVLGDKGRSLGATWADFDGDGWPDLYVANDLTPNQLFRNRGDGTFEDITNQARVADYRSGMGLAVGDWDGDGDLDLFVSHWIAQENALFTNLLHDDQPGHQALRRSRPSPGGGVESSRPPLVFTDEADRYGLGQVSLDFVGWGTFFFDYDNDGRLDLFVANGHTFQRRDAPHLLAPQTSKLFWNRGPKEGFYDVSAVSGPYFQTPYVGRGAAYADYDRDGDLDILVMNHGGPPVLLRNDGGNRNHWLNVRLEGRRSNRSAIGANLRLVAGATSWFREIGDQGPYLSQNELTEHFGLGSLTQADSLVIDWPSGLHQTLTGLQAGTTVTVIEGVGQDTTGQAAQATGGIREFWETYRAATRLRMDGQFAAARDAYRRALELNPQHEDALYYMGGMELELGRYAEARSAWQRLVELNPGSARTHSQLGDLYACADSGAPRNLGTAEAEYHRAFELNREETGPALRLGQLALMRGNLASAASYLDTVIGTNAKSVEAHFLEGYVAWKRAQPERASALFRTTVALARAAAPPPGPPKLPGEGDTKRGSAPAVVVTSRCELFHISPAQLAGLADTDLVGQMNEMYRRLDARLARLAPRSPS